MTQKDYPILEEKENGAQVLLDGRVYSYSNSAMPSSIVSQGRELLASPMRFKLRANGREMPFEPALVLPTRYLEDSCTVAATAESELFYVNTVLTTEPDGCTFADVTLMPRGLTVAQVFGLDQTAGNERAVEQFWLEIPLKKQEVSYYHVSPNTEFLTGDFPADTPKELAFAGFVPKGGFSASFTAQLTLCGEAAGLGVFFTTCKGWNIKDEKRALEVVAQEDAYIIRIHFLDGVPEEWGEVYKDPESAQKLMPVTFRFGFVATPVRQLQKRPVTFLERAFHIDCFKKIDRDYEDFFSHPVVEGSDEIGFDRIKRLGVKTLCLHEKWNDMQNSPILTERSRRRLHYIVEECHKRGIKVIPYFGYELSTLSPYFGKYGRSLLCIPDPDAAAVASWNRWPAQRAIHVCQNSAWGELFCEGVKRIIEEFDLDGLYLDTTLEGHSCGNMLHGCGHIRNGKVVEDYPTLGVRKTLRELSRFVHERGGTICCHSYSAMTLPGLSFCDSLWEGENFQSMLMHGKLTAMPEGHLRALYTGENFGLPMYSLCYSAPPVWTYSNAISMALLHNSMPKPVDIGEPLEETSRIWDIFDAFPLEQSTWHPYFHPHDIKVSDDKVKVSYYEAPGEVLAVCSSVTADFDSDVTIDLTALGAKSVTDAMTATPLTKTGTFTSHFSGFQYLLLHAVK